MEIIEVSCCLLDAHSLTQRGEWQSFVRPTEHPRLDPFCVELTGITQQQVCATMARAVGGVHGGTDQQPGVLAAPTLRGMHTPLPAEPCGSCQRWPVRLSPAHGRRRPHYTPYPSTRASLHPYGRTPRAPTQVDTAPLLHEVLSSLAAWLQGQGALREGVSLLPCTWTDWDLKVGCGGVGYKTHSLKHS